jgi:drug/metabolite transporter (DMT)-like permease
MWARISPTNRAILLMIAAIFLFTAMDATAKAVSLRTSPIMALWARYCGQMVLVLILVAPRIKSVARTEFPGFQLLRSIFLLCATASFFVGLTYLGLAEITAIMDINPVLITLGAALFLGERLGPRRMAGITVSLIGAMIVIRPGMGVFSWSAIFPLIAAVSYAGYSLATRHVGHREDPWTSLFYAAMLGSIVMTGIAAFNWTTPDLPTIGMMIMLAGIGTTGQLLLIRAFTAGEAAMLAPFAYSGLIFATIWGILFFGEFPDLWTIIGALVIVASGLYVWYRETQTNPAVAGLKTKKPR